MRKSQKCIDMTQKNSPFLMSTISSYPQKVFFFLKHPKNLTFKLLNQKIGPSLRLYENILGSEKQVHVSTLCFLKLKTGLLK